MFWGKRQRANCARVVGFKLLFFSRLPAGVKGGGMEKCGEVEREMRDGQPLILRFLASKKWWWIKAKGGEMAMAFLLNLKGIKKQQSWY